MAGPSRHLHMNDMPMAAGPWVVMRMEGKGAALMPAAKPGAGPTSTAAVA